MSNEEIELDDDTLDLAAGGFIRPGTTLSGGDTIAPLPPLGGPAVTNFATHHIEDVNHPDMFSSSN